MRRHKRQSLLYRSYNQHALTPLLFAHHHLCCPPPPPRPRRACVVLHRPTIPLTRPTTSSDARCFGDDDNANHRAACMRGVTIGSPSWASVIPLLCRKIWREPTSFRAPSWWNLSWGWWVTRVGGCSSVDVLLFVVGVVGVVDVVVVVCCCLLLSLLSLLWSSLSCCRCFRHHRRRHGCRYSRRPRHFSHLICVAKITVGNIRRLHRECRSLSPANNREPPYFRQSSRCTPLRQPRVSSNNPRRPRRLRPSAHPSLAEHRQGGCGVGAQRRADGGRAVVRLRQELPGAARARQPSGIPTGKPEHGEGNN